MGKKKLKRITAEHLYDFKLIKKCSISPDGKKVIYSLHWTDKNTEKKYVNLWIISSNGGKPKQLTYGEQTDVNAKWSPDGKHIAFISNRGDAKQRQIYLLSLEGGDARQLSKLKGNLGNFEWSPNGKKILLSFRAKDKAALKRERNEKNKKLGVVAYHYTRTFYKLDGQGYLPQNRWGIQVINVKDGQAKVLTTGEEFEDQFPTWSPDGKHIAFVSNRTEEPELNIWDADIYILNVKSKELRALNVPSGDTMLPSFSPDGKWIAYVGTKYPSEWWRNNQILLVPTDGSAEPISLTEQYDFPVHSLTLNDMVGRISMMPPTWSNDGTSLYFQMSQHGTTTINKIAVESKELTPIFNLKGTAGAFSLSKDQTQMAFVYANMYDPSQLAIQSTNEPNNIHILTNINAKKIFFKVDLGNVEEVWFKGSGDNDLQGWILTPPDFDREKKYPAILEIHGGPLLQYGDSFMHEFFYLAAQGYVVFFCNPRGGQGYGEAHSKAIWHNWGTVDYEDVMTFTDLVAAKPYVDENRLGVTGGSYGGYMTNWIIGHTNRFKTAVTQRSVSNLISMWGSSDFNWIFQETMGGKTPYESIDDLWRMSPIRYLQSAKTPTLVIHSEKDYRCCLEQGEQVFVALKKLGVDTELVIFPDEPHGLSRNGRTDRRIVRLEHILRWMDKYLKEEEIEH